jgi:serine/threonine-protein kinase
MSAPVREGDLLANKYLVERVIGAGGMGVVVAARHVHLDEWVAIKFLLPEALSDPGLVKRFLREGKAASKIRSEHVARVYDVGSLENGAPYIVMEFLEGSDLAALVKAHGPLPVAVAVEYLLQACEAIAEAHAVGIIHRDIKPSNLFLAARRDGSPVVKVIDFGISKMTGDAGMDVTKTADARGSMLFMAPEQMISPRNADARMDIWALGISLHYLLARSYPFQATTVPELCALILQREPTPLRAARPDAPARLEACILRCLRKAPEERYANVAELAEALVEFAPPSAMVSAERARRMLSSPPRTSATSLPAISPAISAGGVRVETTAVAQGLPTGAPVADDATRKVAGKPGASLFMPVVIGVTITSIVAIAAASVAWRYASGPSVAQATSTSPEGADPAAPAEPPSSAAPLPSSPPAAKPVATVAPRPSARKGSPAPGPVPSAKATAATPATPPAGGQKPSGVMIF